MTASGCPSATYPKTEITEGIIRLARFTEAEAEAIAQLTAVYRKGNCNDQGDTSGAQPAAQVGVDVPMTIEHGPDRSRRPESGGAPVQHAANAPRIAGVGTAVTGESYSQEQLLDTFRITDPKVRSVFLNSAIQRRYLTLPALGDDGARVQETQGDLLGKHKALAVDMGARAIDACLKDTGAIAVGHQAPVLRHLDRIPHPRPERPADPRDGYRAVTAAGSTSWAWAATRD